MKLYYSPGACSLADHIALIESGLSFETEAVDLKTKKTASGGDYTAINSKGYVPALEFDDGYVLTENIAILSFIAAESGRLSPRDGMQHWRVLETTAFISTELHKNFKPFFSPDAGEEDKAEARETLTKRFALIETQLGNRDFVVGDTMSIADCYLFVMLFWASTKVELALPEALAAYYDRLRSSPSVSQALKEEGLDQPPT